MCWEGLVGFVYVVWDGLVHAQRALGPRFL